VRLVSEPAAKVRPRQRSATARRRGSAATSAAQGVGAQRGASPAAPSRAELARALAAGEFKAYLQPQIDLRTRRVTGVEALARWARLGRGVLTPAIFLSQIERCGLMPQLTDAILTEALRWWAERAKSGGEPLSVAVNVSAANLDEGLLSSLDLALRRWLVPPRWLTVEITETTIMQNGADTAELLGRLKSLGVQLSIDDFGTGYSSLARLQHLPIDEVKIDREFVRDLHEGADRGMVRAIADLGRNFGLRVLAEGVEHQHELTLLAGMGCDLAQGFSISPPLEAAALEAWLERHRPRAAPATDAGPRPPAPDPKSATSARQHGVRGLGERLRSLACGARCEGPLDAVIQRMLGELAVELQAKFAACWLLEPETGQLEPLALWSAPAGGEMGALIAATREVRYAPGRGLPGTALAEGSLLRSADLYAEPSFVLAAEAHIAGCSTALALPLHSNNKPVGVLGFLASGPIPAGLSVDAALRQVGCLLGEFVCARRAEQRVTEVNGTLAALGDAIARLGCAGGGELRERLCSSIQKLGSADAVLLWEPSADGLALIVTACCGVQCARLQVSLTDEHSGAAAAFHTGSASFIADVAQHALPSKRLAAVAQAASALYQPIRLGEEGSLAVLAIAWKHKRARMSPAEKLAIDLLARSAAPLLAGG
jgi:EAL domain-containing protein (putative c-di-GMP-specific phosphodiesterase class I)